MIDLLIDRPCRTLGFVVKKRQNLSPSTHQNPYEWPTGRAHGPSTFIFMTVEVRTILVRRTPTRQLFGDGNHGVEGKSSRDTGV